MEYNIYCDESCHLPNDGEKIMVIGGLLCPKGKAQQINKEIFAIKERHKVYRFAEIKWTKVSNSKLDMYKELIDLFFDHTYLQFRAVVATGKDRLDYNRYRLTHDDWYQRIYYLVLREMLSINDSHYIYADIKDTKGDVKVQKLKEVLNNAIGYFFDDSVKNIQLVRSDQIQLMQLADLLIGAVSYANRNLNQSQAKVNLINYIEQKSGRILTMTTPKSENKMNLFKWEPRRIDDGM